MHATLSGNTGAAFATWVHLHVGGFYELVFKEYQFNDMVTTNVASRSTRRTGDVFTG